MRRRFEATLPLELKRELYAMLSREVARQLKKRRLKEQELLTDFGEWRKKRRKARR